MKFRVFINNSFDGPFAVPELCQLPGFSLDTSVCPDGDFSWQPARQYPAITRFVQQKTSGDYDPGVAVAPDSVKVPGGNWRQSVIGANVPETKPRALPPLPPAQEIAKKPLKESGKSLFKSRIVSDIREHRKGILLVLLGYISVGVYYPQTEELTTFLAGISANDSAIMVMGTRFHRGGSPHKGTLWKHKMTRSSPTPAIKAAPSSAPEIVEIGSEDLGNGMVSKTIVVTEIRDGVRVQQTKTIEVPAHPHKTKRKKVAKSAPTQISARFNGPMA